MTITPETRLPFGQYCGASAAKVAYEDPAYLLWLHEDTEHELSEKLLELCKYKDNIPSID